MELSPTGSGCDVENVAGTRERGHARGEDGDMQHFSHELKLSHVAITYEVVIRDKAVNQGRKNAGMPQVGDAIWAP